MSSEDELFHVEHSAVTLGEGKANLFHVERTERAGNPEEFRDVLHETLASTATLHVSHQNGAFLVVDPFRASTWVCDASEFVGHLGR